SALHDMAEAGDQLPVNRISQPELWRVIRAKRWAGERDIVMPRSELIGAGVVTSSSGITVYRGAAYPEKYRGNVFICEVAGNLFYRLQLTPEGPTFKAARVDTNAEMVASTDNWFRPVNFVNAPDGTLHVVDMYRENIEHPWSIPDDIHAAVDLESGRERGRIWRLAPPTFRLPKPPRLGRATTLELVATLENPNVWWRETAQRLLVERQDLAALPELHKMVKQGRTAQARLHALCTVAGLKSVTDEDLLAALVDEAAGVRENAVKLAESSAGSVAVRDALLNLASDLDPFVRFQLAFTLGQINDPRSAAALSTIAGRDAVDPWFRTAVLSSAANTGEQLLTQLLSNFASNNSPTEIIRELAEIVGVRGQTAEMQRVLSSAVEKDNANSILPGVVTGIGEGLKRSGKSIRAVQWNVETSKAIARIFSESALSASDPQKPLDARVGAIRLLTFDDFGRVTATLVNLLDSKHPQEVQLAAVRAISGFPQPEIAPLLLARWRKAVPAIRSEIVLAMLSGRNRVLPLLQAIENDLIPANQVPFARRASLLRNSDADVKALATKIFGDASPRQRKEVIARYEAALSMKGDASRGKAVFESSCASCHRAGEIGNDVGPNLATIRQWNPEQILNNILDPNREVAPNFVSYMVETTDGRTLEGLIANETAASLTLKRADAVTETILRRDINQLSGSGLSLMPEALETAITIDQMADLITFLLSPE
ncbi:MAG: DUF7133 domain-containing protein, partial [Limisphaerales bacterium]